ncbi:MAG: 50S ribosomal protein L17 [bacterium]|nr:50S ribosomal protein L17 [bacterium]
MRHGNKVKKLNRTKSHREATLFNLMRNVFTHYGIVTTILKAKESSKVIDRTLTFAKKGEASRYELNKILRNDKKIIKHLLTTIVPKLGERKSGFTRIVRLPPRKGDGAQLAFIELLGFDEERKKKIDARETKRQEKEEKRLKGEAV